MAQRVTADQLKSYLGLETADTTDLTLFLSMGNMIVEDELLGKGLSDNRLFLIELNLDAHYGVLSLEKGGLEGQKAGSSSETYQLDRPMRPNLSRTRFGQQAVALDPTGVLSNMDSPGGVAEFRVLKEDPSSIRTGYCV